MYVPVVLCWVSESLEPLGGRLLVAWVDDKLARHCEARVDTAV